MILFLKELHSSRRNASLGISQAVKKEKVAEEMQRRLSQGYNVQEMQAMQWLERRLLIDM